MASKRFVCGLWILCLLCGLRLFAQVQESTKSACQTSEFRAWRSASGQFSTRARLIEVNGKTVTLEKDNGVEITVLQEQLSEADRQFIRTQASPPTKKGTASSAAATRNSLSASVPVPLTDTVKEAIAKAEEWVSQSAPKPKETKVPVAGAEYDLTGLNARAIKVENIAGRPVWSRDGDALYIVTTGGSVRRVTFPDFVETHRLFTAVKCRSVCVTKSFLVVLLDAGELLILDPDSLSVIRRVAIIHATEVSGSPALENVFVTAGDSVHVVDALKGRAVSQLKFTQNRSRSTGRGTVTPDGKYLFTQHKGTVRRYRIEGESLRMEQGGFVTGGNPQELCVCADSKHVALPCGGGNRGRYSGFAGLNYGTYLFSVDDLELPRTGIASGAYPRTVDVDPKTGDVYTQNSENMLLVFGSSGSQLSQHRGILGDSTQRFVVHPKGGSLIVQMEKVTLWVKLPPRPVVKEDGTIDDSGWLAKETPQPTAASDNLLGKKSEHRGATAYEVKFGTSSVLGDAVFSTDGSRLYTVSKAGLVRLIRVPEFDCTTQIDFQAECSSLELSKEGLVVGVSGKDHLYLLDEHTLKIKRRIRTVHTQVITSSPATSIGFALPNRGSRPTRLAAFDLVSGRMLWEKTMGQLHQEAEKSHPGKLRLSPSGIRFIKATPDGKHLFAADLAIYRFRIDGINIRFEEATPIIAEYARSVAVSGDSKLTALVGSLRQNITGLPATDDVGVYLFGTSNIAAPKVGIKGVQHARSIAFDAKTGHVYVQTFEPALAVFRADGTEKQRLSLHNNGRDDPLIAPPSGGAVLSIGVKSSARVEFAEQ